MKRLPPLSAVLALSLLPLTVPAWGANLGALYELARDHDAKLAAAREALKAGQEKLPQGKSGLLPELAVKGKYSYLSSEAAGGWSASHPRSYELSLTQPLYRKQNLETFEQGKIQALLSDQQFKLAEQELLLRVAVAYFEVLQAQDVVTTVQAQKQAYAEQLAQARKSFEVGAATITDTHEAQARFDLTGAQEIAALNDLDVKRRVLERIINREAPKLATLVEGVRLPLPQPSNMEAWVTQAEAGSLRVVASQSSLEVARREVEKQRGAYLPTVDLQALYSDSADVSSAGKSGQVGVVLGWNLYQGGGTDSRMREAVANQEKARYELDDARRQARLEARQGFLGVLSGDAQVKALEQALVSSEAQLKSTKLGLEVGVRTRVDVLNAEQQLFTTRRDLSAAKYKTLLASLELKAAAGSLGPDDLKALDALLRD